MEEEEVHNEIISHTKKIVKNTFDPQKADSIFTQAQVKRIFSQYLLYSGY